MGQGAGQPSARGPWTPPSPSQPPQAEAPVWKDSRCGKCQEGKGSRRPPTCRTTAREGTQRQTGLTVSLAPALFRRMGL